MPWVKGHVFQGQVVLPGTSYISAITAAVKALAGASPVRLVELCDVVLHRAVVLRENNPCEFMTDLHLVLKGPHLLSAEFSFSAAQSDSDATPEMTCSGRLEVHLGRDEDEDGAEQGEALLPSPSQPPPNLSPVDVELFYLSLKKVGLAFSGLFRGTKSAQRSLGYASTSASWDDADDGIVEGVTMRAMADHASSADGGCVLFSHVKWDSDLSTGVDKVVLEKETPEQVDGDGDDGHLGDAMGRTALYYYRTMLKELSPGEISSSTWHHRMFVQSAQHWVDEVGAGRHPTVKSEWLDDTKEVVWQGSQRFQDRIDMVLMRAVGENLTSIIRGEKQPLEVMMEDDMLTRFYVDGHGLGLMNDHIARAVGQVAHRYPRANILEIGAGTGGTTQKVLRTVGNAYGHYTFTDVSPGFFERAADRFSDQVRRRRMTFQVLDIEKDIVSQGFPEGAYDVIVAANVLHATKHLQDTMRQVRRLLKPGEYLVMMEITGDLLLGDEGRKWAPGIPSAQWDDLLRRTGFSGVDHIASDSPVPQHHYLSMLVAQAVDDRVDLLRRPLSNLATLPPLADVAKLLIIGGDTPAVARLARGLKSALAPWSGTTIEITSSLDRLAVGSLYEERVSAISLTELDQPLFGHDNFMTATRLQSLQTFLQRARSVLWVTAGCRGPNPQANMFAGIARAVRAEQRDINLQLLDITWTPKDEGSNPTVAIAEAFVRLAVAGQRGFVDASDRQPMLWTTETEPALDAGSLLIPRLVPDDAINDQYNAAQRVIVRHIDAAGGAGADWDFEVESTDDGILSLTGLEHALSRCLMRARASSSNGPVVLMDVQLSVALLDPEHRHFLCYGSIIAAGSTPCNMSSAFAVTQSNASVALVHVDGAIPFTYGGDSPSGPSAPRYQASRLLEALAGQLVARSLAPRVPRRGSVLLYEPAETLVRAIAGCRLWRGRQVYCMTSSLQATALPKGWIPIDARALDSLVRQTIPGDVAAMIDFSAQEAGMKRDFRPCLPADCVVIRFEPAFLETDGEALGHAYADALGLVDSEAAAGSDREVRMVLRDALPGRQSSAAAYPSIIDWHAQDSHVRVGSTSTKVPVQVKPLSTTGIFSSSKTHLMVGLNGDLGQSICGFMARNGARHIAITSRGGDVNPEWLETMQRQGINVGVYGMDVTNKGSIRAALEQMRINVMPSVGGVANGALVLRDKLFLNMDADSFNDTLRPKVDGSRNLDELFGDELDYFVLFSSLATVAGNAGQSNYHAANMFMAAGLAANRRARGLPASVMHVGVFADAGYVTRQGRQLLEHLRKQFFMPTSESDAHQLFTEAVLASPPDSGLPSDICMGLEPFPDRPDDAELSRPSWVSDHRLSHFVLLRPDEDQQAAGSKGGVNDGKAPPLSQRIDGTGSAQEAEATLQDAFSAKLETLLQLDAGSINVHAPLLDLGFDFLLAVETRSWFLKEVSVDVPVLRLLGGETIHEICADAAAQYLSFRSTNGSDTGEGADTNASLTSKTDNSDGPVASSLSSSPSIATPPPTSSSTTSTRASLDLPSAQEDLKPEAPLLKDETEGGHDTHSGTNVQTQSRQLPEKRLRNTSRVERLSYLQSRLWYLGKALDDSAASNIAVCYTITGPLDVARLREALVNVVAHHPSLRTCFYTDDETGELTRGLLRQPLTSALLLKQVRAVTRADGVIDREFSALKKHEWDLEYGETFGATLVHVEDDDSYVAIFGYPLIVIDGVSWSIFLRDLGRAYSMQPLSRQAKLCIDAAAEQRRAVESMSGAMQESVSYWERLHTELPQALPFLPFASVTRRRPLRRYEVHKSIRNVDGHLVAKIKDVSRALRATPFHFYLATAQALFAKLLPDLAEICIGVFDANRPEDGSLADIIGYFVNVLPLRFRLDDKRQAPFAEMVRHTSTRELEARRHGHVPFDVILDRLNVLRDDSVSPLCQVAFNYRVGAMADVALGDCRLSLDNYSDVQNNRYDLSFGLFESAAGSYSVTVTCKSYLYSWDATEALIGAYVYLLDTLASDASRTLSEYTLSGAAIETLEGISLGEEQHKA
ncbi:Putative Condensation domain, phosphopantetheine binding ACP domain, methyltransferase type 12 [Colletotrichum destructivum]|uniref:Condensation domain, phosphopantetheine binding ACP domain, methyltransferase type 12 n=1 Tax=Colletotrichum destructivum TaxID=34406 RepID=A0AAX4I7X8_9PEZI|nr:Putative Condensation domain, phosphopantetheine binding ACP domain, methyltransferase type 12 [Colletotrichum destructivum]